MFRNSKTRRLDYPLPIKVSRPSLSEHGHASSWCFTAGRAPTPDYLEPLGIGGGRASNAHHISRA